MSSSDLVIALIQEEAVKTVIFGFRSLQIIVTFNPQPAPAFLIVDLTALIQMESDLQFKMNPY